MIPKKGQYFRIEHKGFDKSWRSDIFLCTGSDDGIVTSKMVSSNRRYYNEIFNFPSSEWNFFTVSSEVLEANGITIKNEKIMAKTKADLHREWARVLDMCEGTEVNPITCWKLGGDIQSSIPNLNGKPKDYEFAVAILEGNPVFKGDKVYFKKNGEEFNWNLGELGSHKSYQEYLTWNKPNRTFNLNGIELPCPITGSFGVYLGFAGKDYFFGSVDDRNKVSQAIIKILDEAKV